MSQRLKMLLGFIALIATTALLGFGLFTLFFSNPPQVTDTVTDTTTDTTDDTEPQRRLSLAELAGLREGTIVDDEITLPVSDTADGSGRTATQQLTSSAVETATHIGGDDIAFFNPADGRFYSISDDGELNPLSSQTFLGAENTRIADSGDIVAVEFPDGTNILYDFEREEQITLPNHWEDFEFSQDGSEVINKTVNADSRSNALVVSSSDGSRTQVVAAIGDAGDDIIVNWSPDDRVVGFAKTGSSQSGFGRNEIYLIGADGDEVGAITVEGGNFDALWSPSGHDILYSVALSSNDDRPSLWYTNATGDVGSQRERIALETWVDKCTFKDEATVICAVPREVTDGSGYDARLITADDDVYQLNLQTQRISYLGAPETDMQMFNLNVSDDGSLLYFTDDAGRLNYMRL